MKNLTLLALFLAVATGAYGLGRRHARPSIESLILEKTAAAGTNASFPKTAGTEQRATVVENFDKMPFARTFSAAEKGFRAARENLEAALKAVDSIPPSERQAYLTGVFSFVGRTFSPAEALKIYQKTPESQHPYALKALVAEWVDARSGLNEEERQFKREQIFAAASSRVGLEAGLTALLASAKPDSQLIGAWLDAFGSHSARSEILATLTSQFPRDNSDAYLNRMNGWTDWEKERAARAYLWSWAQEKPREAWDWYRSDPKRFGQNLSSSIFGPWANADPEALKNILGTLADPGQREAAIGAIGRTLAMKNTDAAVDWADGLADANERALAQKAVYNAAPRGIGAVLDWRDGFPVLRGIVPGGPLEGTGIMPGDQLAEIQQSDGTRQPLYGIDLQNAVNLIRGDAGTETTLRVLRKNAATGALEEHLIRVKRDQLYMNEKTLPKASE